MQKIRSIAKHPIIIGFFAILFLVAAVDMAKPAKEMSELENRRLTQQPAFNMTAFLNNEWTFQYGEFIRDQFLFRDDWVSMQSLFEVGLGKLEAGGVWYARDGYQIAKNDTWSDAQARLFPLNVQSVCELAARHPGLVRTMIVPSPAFILSDLLRGEPNQIDEGGMTDAMFAEFAAAGAEVIDLRPAFMAAHAAGRQIYYRTDHHWTTTGGALLAYEAFCAAAGREAMTPDASLLREVADFYGTNFAKTKRLGTRPDTLSYYDLPNAMVISSLASDGGIQSERTGIMEAGKLDGYDKYAAFLHGNKGYSVIEGDGEGSVLVIKDSYANCFVPYLVANYATVGVIDLRMWPNVDSTIEAGGFDEILVLYSFASFSEDAYLSNMADAKQT